MMVNAMMTYLNSLGLSAGVALAIIVLALFGDRLVKHRSDQTRLRTETQTKEREILSAEQEQFRKDLITRLETAQAQHNDCEQRVAQHQIMLARLIACVLKQDPHGATMPLAALLAELGTLTATGSKT